MRSRGVPKRAGSSGHKSTQLEDGYWCHREALDRCPVVLPIRNDTLILTPSLRSLRVVSTLKNIQWFDHDVGIWTKRTALPVLGTVL